jgi:hypothetical protein
MFRRPTVFIVGAGASREVNLPLGNELKNRIATALNIRFQGFNELISGSRLIADCLRRHALEVQQRDINYLLRHCWEIVAGMPGAISIDNYLDQRGQDADREICAKLAIVETISEAERNSLLFIDPRERDQELDFAQIEAARAYLVPLGRMVTSGARPNDLERMFENLTIVTFNYDRCIEHFFLRRLMNQYWLNEQAAAVFARRLRVHHVYGSIGTLPWAHPNNVGVSFGEPLGSGPCLAAARQIRTFTESHTDADLQAAIHNAIARAHTVVYLGFAYHEISMQLIHPNDDVATERIFATRFEVSDPNWQICRNSLLADRRFRNPAPPVLDGGFQLRCGPFLQDWERQILA